MPSAVEQVKQEISDWLNGTLPWIDLRHCTPFGKDVPLLMTLGLVSNILKIGFEKIVLQLIAPFSNMVQWVADHMGMGEFLPSNWLMDLIATFVCGARRKLMITIIRMIMIMFMIAMMKYRR